MTNVNQNLLVRMQEVADTEGYVYSDATKIGLGVGGTASFFVLASRGAGAVRDSVVRPLSDKAKKLYDEILNCKDIPEENKMRVLAFSDENHRNTVVQRFTDSFKTRPQGIWYKPINGVNYYMVDYVDFAGTRDYLRSLDPAKLTPAQQKVLKGLTDDVCSEVTSAFKAGTSEFKFQGHLNGVRPSLPTSHGDFFPGKKFGSGVRKTTTGVKGAFTPKTKGGRWGAIITVLTVGTGVAVQQAYGDELAAASTVLDGLGVACSDGVKVDQKKVQLGLAAVLESNAYTDEQKGLMVAFASGEVGKGTVAARNFLQQLEEIGGNQQNNLAKDRSSNNPEKKSTSNPVRTLKDKSDPITEDEKREQNRQRVLQFMREHAGK